MRRRNHSTEHRGDTCLPTEDSCSDSWNSAPYTYRSGSLRGLAKSVVLMALDRVAQIGVDAHARTRTDTIIFRESFTLSALEDRQPAGTYQVEIDEERLPTMSAPAYRRVGTWLRLPAPAGSRHLDRLVNVDAAELETALAADAIGASRA